MSQRIWRERQNNSGLKLWKASPPSLSQYPERWMDFDRKTSKRLERRALRRSEKEEIKAQLRDIEDEFWALIDELRDFGYPEEEIFIAPSALDRAG